MLRKVVLTAMTLVLLFSSFAAGVDYDSARYSSNPVVRFFQKIWSAVRAQINRSITSLQQSGSVNCVVALDVSGSMAANFYAIRRQTSEFLGIFDQNDYLTLFTFDENTSHPFSGMMHENNKSNLKRWLRSMTATGQWTDLKKAARTSEVKLTKMMQNNPGNTGIVLMVTDGKDDPPPAIKALRKQNGQAERFDLTDKARDWRVVDGWQIYQIDGRAALRSSSRTNRSQSAGTPQQANSTVARIKSRISFARNMAWLLLLLLVLLLIVLGWLAGRKRRRGGLISFAFIFVSFLLLFIFLPEVMTGINWINSQLGALFLG